MSKKVLFVDDDLRIAELFKNYSIEYSNVTITCAQNGIQALELVKKEFFDAIVTDIKMPKMDGIEFVSCMRALGIQTPVLFLTGYGDKESAIRAVKLGAVDFIEKPVSIDIVFVSLQKAILESEVSYERNIDRLSLSGKLRSVVLGILKGKTNSEIAHELQLSEPTVKYHVGNLFKKFQSSSRTELRENILVELKKAVDPVNNWTEGPGITD